MRISGLKRTDRGVNDSGTRQALHEGGAVSAGRASQSNKRRRLAAFAGTLVLSVVMMIPFTLSSFADDLVDTVPGDENYYTNGYVNTYLKGVAGLDARYNTPGYGPYTMPGVVQSRSPSSATSFAAGLPLGTIFIDQTKIGPNLGETKVVATDPQISSGLGVVEDRMSYDGRKSGAKKLEAGKINELEGELFTVTFKDAAVLPNGDRANLVITYSNARIVVDQRYLYAPAGENYYHGAVFLAQGNGVAYGGTDNTNFNTAISGWSTDQRNNAANQVDTTVQGLTNKTQTFSNSNSKYPSVGLTIDVAYKIVNKDGTPTAGTYVFAVCGINLDRDPDKATQNNVGKTLWYSYDTNFGGQDGTKHSYFSEAMEITGGKISDNVYLRPNNNLEDNPEKITGLKGQYYYANVSKSTDGKIKFIGNEDRRGNTDDTAYGGNDNSYNSGFVTLADAATGFRVTATGHGNYENKMNSYVFNSKQIWYRYTSGSGEHGRIETTSEGNWGGDLSKGQKLDGGTLTKPDTYVVTEGKTVTYTMTPDTGYKLKKLTVNGQEVKYSDGHDISNEPVSRMKKGDEVTVKTAAGNDGVLKYEEDGTYTFKFVYAKHDEKILVEWEPTTADLLISKIWDDDNDADGMRKGADGDENKWPKVKLQQSTDGGASWIDVKKNAHDGILGSSVKPENVPSGETGSSGIYSDGIFVKNNDKTGVHPFTWQYLPVFTYDSSGRADRVILYRIVEGNADSLSKDGYDGSDPALTGYKSPQYADGQTFYLTSEVSKTWDGWLIYTDGTNDYVIKDGTYYDVSSDGVVGDRSQPQPDPDILHPADAQGNYRTADKAIPYQSVSVKNEHTVSDIYVDVTKFWNDAYLYDSEAHEPKTTKYGNEYDRRDITFTLHGTINNGARVVDLAPNDPSTTDLKLTISKDENESKEAATGENGDGTYRIDGSHYGARFSSLQAYYEGQLIEYTVTESYTDIDSFTVTGGKLDEKKEGSSLVGYTMSDLTKVEKNEELLGYTANFINTPVIDDEFSPLPVTISKKDGYTDAPLKDAVFTVYTDPFNKVVPGTSTYRQIGNYTVLKDAQDNEYVLKNDGCYYVVNGDAIGEKAEPQPSPGSLEKEENTNYRKAGSEEIWTDKKGHNYVKRGDDYYAVDADGNISGSKADPQPSAAALSRIKTSGEVDEITVITGSDGMATVNFNKTGTYYIVETGAPEGYEADTTMYKFVVDKELNTVTLENEDAGHDTKWWKRLFDLIFGDGTNTETNWSQQVDKRGGTLTVKDTPLTSNVMVRKIWDDANDQDGVRPDTANELPYVILQYTTTPEDENSWKTAQVYDSKASVPGLVNVDEEQFTHAGGAIHSSGDNAYTWTDLPAYRDGKVVYYRVHEWGTVLSDGIYRITANQTVSTKQTVFTMVNASVNPVNRIVDITNTHTPQLLTVNATKHWNDNSNAENKRPETLKITLYRIVNNEETKVCDLTLNGEADVPGDSTYYEVEPSDSGNSWNAVFKDLPAFESGSPITYRLEETLTDGDKVNYVNSYSVSYTNTSGSHVDTADKDSVASNDVKRTFVTETETVKIGDVTYDVYVKDEARYVRKDAGSGYTYYEINTDGSVDFSKPADPQPQDPAVSKIRVETTTASIKVDNVLKNNVNTTKYWIGGATANVRFTLYRTSKADPTDMVTKDSTADPIATGEKITVGSETYDTYIHANGNTYVDKSNVQSVHEWHEVTGTGTTEDPYVIATDPSTPQIRTWTPFDSDGVTLIDGWERVDDHLFVSSAFKTSLELPGDDEDHVFEDLPQMDPSGNRYTYRVLETTTAGKVEDDRFEGHYSSDGLTVTNINRKVAEGSADVDVIKDLQGRAWDARYKKTGKDSDKDEFYFWIAPIKGVDSDGTIIPGEVTDAPLPGNGEQYGRAVSQNTAVGNTSREVSFSPILVDLYHVGGAGQSKEFYYKVYEASDNNGTPVNEKDGKGITYDGTGSGLTWEPKTAVLKVVAAADNNGVVTTQHYWMDINKDGGSTTVNWVTNTPVFRNTYASEGNAKVWIEKNVASRRWNEYRGNPLDIPTGDAYQFTIVGISGAALNTPGTADDSYTTMPLVSNTVLNPQKDLQQLSDSEWAFGVTGNPYSGDMLGDDGEEYYIYEIYEEKTTTSNKDSLGISNYKVENVTYDDSRLFAKLQVKDNWDGTLNFDVSYYTDASCKDDYKIKDHKVWIVDKGSEKRLLSVQEAADAERMLPEQREKAGYKEVYAAYFTNCESVDIPVTKQWIGGPAIEDVTVHLVQHLFPLSDEAALDGTATTGLTGVAFVEDQEKKWSGTDDFWQKVGYVRDLPRGDFLNADGTPKQGIGSDGVSKTYSNIEGFNKDLPKYVEKGGVTYRAVYKLVENDTSDTYTREYDPQYYINRNSFDDPSKGLVVKNTVVATNEANIAAVKQLLGRSWASSDDFTFELTPLGKAKYDENGNFDDIEETTDIPMPADDAERHSTTSDGIATTHALSDTTTVDPNGNLERLARFGKIEFKVDDLVYDSKDKHMQGDFFYIMKEKLPDIVTTGSDQAYPVEYTYTTGSGKDMETVTKPITDKKMPTLEDGQTLKSVHFNDGIDYDCDEHTVHVRVRENRTSTLTVQIGYDESTTGEIKTGTQFTPVYTNRYTADADIALDVVKYIMGRKWKEGDYFDFDMRAIGGAPMVDANREKDFPDEKYDTGSDADIEAALSHGWAAHTKSGAHRIRMKVTNTEKTVQTATFPAVRFTMDDLSVSGSETEVITAAEWEKLSPKEKAKYTPDGDKYTRTYAVSTDPASGTENELKYSDGTDVIPGTRYGRFVYAANEVKAGATDLKLDADTEYARITIIDKGDGTLDCYIDMFEDRYCSKPRYIRVESKKQEDLENYYEYIYNNTEQKYVKAGTPFDASKTYYEKSHVYAFVNQLTRGISVTKAWAGAPTEDVTFKLQWSVDAEAEGGAHWYDASETLWLADALAGKGGQRTIPKKATGDELTLSCEGLPAYANILRHDDKTGESGDNVDLNDRWVYYRVVEITPQKAEARYNKTPYTTGDTKDTKVTEEGQEVDKYSTTPYHTEAEMDSDGVYIAEDQTFYVTNFPEDITGKAQVGVVKQYIGKDWDDETFTFRIEPVKSMIGSETVAVEEGKDRIVEYRNKVDSSTISVSDYDKLSPVEKEKYEAVTKKNTMPSYGQNYEAIASDGTSKVSVNEHAANFSELTIKRSDLAQDSEGKMRGTFFYKISEVVPDGAEKTKEVCGKDVDGNDVYYYAGAVNGNRVKYTTEEHMVKIVAVDDGGGDIDITVSFDDRKSGEYVPVYTNFALEKTPIEGSKTWSGGADDEHVNGSVSLNDDQTEIINSSDGLALKLQRRPDKKGAEVSDVSEDDAGNEIVIVWVSEDRETEEGEIRYIPQTKGDGTYTVKAKIGNQFVDPVLDTVDEDGNKYIYSVVEKKVPAGYEVSYNGMDVTNTDDSGSVDVIVSKKWDDSKDQDGKRPDSVTVSISAEGWNGKDINNKDVESMILSDGINWKSAFRDLPEKNKAGDKYDYIISEDPVPEEYSASVKYQSSGDKSWSTTKPDNWNGKAVITNSYVPGDRSISATKVWDGETEEVGTSLRTDVVLHLYGIGENGRVVYDAGTQTIKMDANGEPLGDAIWTDVPKRHYEDSDLDWMLTEEPVFGYTSEVTGDITDGFTVTNTYSGPTTSVEVTKEWKDTYYDEYSVRPDVTYKLLKKVGNGEDTEIVEVDTQTVKEKDNWSYKWTDLPVTENTGSDGIIEEPVLYSVEEVPLDADYGYLDPIIECTAPGEFKAVNIHKTKTIDINALKIWVDDDDADGIRPDHVTLRLMNGKKEVRKATVTADDEWKHTFMNLPATDEYGKPIEYNVKEIEIDGYVTEIIGDQTNGFEITNTHNAGSLMTLRATKKWEGDEKDLNKRKDVTLQLVRIIYEDEHDSSGSRGIVKGSQKTVATGNRHDENMTAEWTDLPTVIKGKRVSYTVEETSAIHGYTTHYSDVTEVPDKPGEYEMTVTNILGEIPELADVIYVDPKNPKGQNRMIVKSTSYRTPEEAKSAAENRTNAPKDPSHKGVKFIGWDLNWDDNDNYVMVALYSDIPAEVTPVTTYIDPLSGKPVLISELTNDPSSVKVPKDPRHKNVQFVGWVKSVDAGGNTIFVAKFDPDCANRANTTGKGKGVGTGDSSTEIYLWIATMFAAGALLSIYGEKRRRENRRYR